MIKDTKLLSMAEVKEYLKKENDSEAEVLGFIKKFIKIDLKKAKELRKKIEELNLMKIKPEHIVKIIDIIPEEQEDLNKIFTDVSLDEDETKKTLEAIKDFK